MEQLPSHLYELCEKKSFGELSPVEKNEVLQHLSEAEYNAMHEAAVFSHSLAFNKQTITGNTDHKALLLNRLKQKNKKPPFLIAPVGFWKVAASFLLLCMVYFYFYTRKVLGPVQYLTHTDTVYIEKQLPSERVFDTVYLTRSGDKNTVAPAAKKTHPSFNPNIQAKEDLINNSNLRRLSISEYDKVQNSKKGRNIKDDSLIRSIGFVHF